DDQAPRDEPRVLPRRHHAGQVVQRGVDVGAADRLDERGDDVVVLVAVAVVADGGDVDGALDVGQADARDGALVATVLVLRAVGRLRGPVGQDRTGGRLEDG